MPVVSPKATIPRSNARIAARWKSRFVDGIMGYNYGCSINNEPTQWSPQAGYVSTGSGPVGKSIRGNGFSTGSAVYLRLKEGVCYSGGGHGLTVVSHFTPELITTTLRSICSLGRYESYNHFLEIELSNTAVSSDFGSFDTVPAEGLNSIQLAITSSLITGILQQGRPNTLVYTISGLGLGNLAVIKYWLNGHLVGISNYDEGGPSIPFDVFVVGGGWDYTGPSRGHALQTAAALLFNAPFSDQEARLVSSQPGVIFEQGMRVPFIGTAPPASNPPVLLNATASEIRAFSARPRVSFA